MKCLHYFKMRVLREAVVIYRFLSTIKALMTVTSRSLLPDAMLWPLWRYSQAGRVSTLCPLLVGYSSSQAGLVWPWALQLLAGRQKCSRRCLGQGEFPERHHCPFSGGNIWDHCCDAVTPGCCWVVAVVAVPAVLVTPVGARVYA